MDLEEIVDAINTYIAKQPWFDMEVLTWNGDLTIKGSLDFAYGHTLEVKFFDVFHVNISSEWRTDTSFPALELVKEDEAVQVNKTYQVEKGNFIFKLISEDHLNPFYVIAKHIEFNTDKVLYYLKNDLEENERIADWVK